MEGILQAKQLYNVLLERHSKALKFFDNNTIANDKKETWIPQYIEIVESLGDLLDTIKVYTRDEALEGFKI